MKFINRIRMDKVKAQINESLDMGAMYKKYKKYLKNAKDGEVVTRFPPEPSGYLHIGHLKAACLNYHYAKMFNGKMLLRFDDTNPKKEKMEFEESIKKDLKTLGIVADQVSHTSDHFELILEKAEQFIKDGLAYCDNTPELQMKEERMQMIDSKYRNTTVDENLQIFEKMKQGQNKDWCLRAKINMQSKNGCLRDPVIYRSCDIPHHIYKDKYKIYPTYDFACPIVDSIEGVTHALRSSEYHDRNAIYSYMLKKMNLRKVAIQDFSRLNFINTTLSKRKLNWFVNEGLVDGWSDPRFPTLQGIMRRGMLPENLIKFMIEQGPSKNTNLQEWDKIWSTNSKLLDKYVPRFTAISSNFVKIKIQDIDQNQLQTEQLQLHPKNKDIGYKTLYKCSEVIIEKTDAEIMEQDQKIVLLKWGIFQLTKVDKNNWIYEAKYLPDDKDFKTPPKITWLANDQKVQVNLRVEEFDHLLTAKKPDAEQNFQDIVNRNSKYTMNFKGEGEMRKLDLGSYVQFERRGFMILDRREIKDTDRLELVFISIPNGKTKAISGQKTHIDNKKLAKVMFKKNIQVNKHKVKVIKEISQGAYGFVYLVEDKNQIGKKYALKKIKTQNQERYDLADRELKFLQKESQQINDHFIQYIDSYIEKKSKSKYVFYILIEFGPYGTLFDLMKTRQLKNQKINENEILQIAGSVCKSLDVLHKRGYMHCDLKIENLLFYDYEKIKLCDFGSVNRQFIDFSKLKRQEYDKYLQQIEKQTTFMYRPPEMCDPYLGYIVNTQVDLWMLGAVIFTLMFFKHPFVDSNKLGIISASYFWPEECSYSQKLENLVRNLLTPNPNLRYNAQQVLQILQNWHNLKEIKLNEQSLQIKKEHFVRQGFRKNKQNSILKSTENLSKKDEEFDFSGLNKLSRKPKTIKKDDFIDNFQFQPKQPSFNKKVSQNDTVIQAQIQKDLFGDFDNSNYLKSKSTPQNQNADFLGLLNSNECKREQEPDFLNFQTQIIINQIYIQRCKAMILYGKSQIISTVHLKQSNIKRTKTQTFCVNEYNVNGICSRLTCPLANGVYATIQEKKGKLYLCMKSVERQFTPNKMWKMIQLSDNYTEALTTVENELQFFSVFIQHKCKQRLTKLTQMLKRMRKLRLKQKEKLTVIKKKTERRDQIRMEKAEQRARITMQIEQEMLDRLKLGTYSNLYDDLLNINQNAFEDYVKKQNQAEENDEIDSVDIDDLEDLENIENNFEYIFNKDKMDLNEFVNNDDLNIQEEDEINDDQTDQNRQKKIKKKQLLNIKKRKIDLMMDDENLEQNNEILNQQLNQKNINQK